MTSPMWQRRTDWIGSEVEDFFVMINVNSGDYVSLNATAQAVWLLLAEPRTVQDLVEALVKEFDVDSDHCRRSVDKLLKMLHEKQLVGIIGRGLVER